MGKNRGYVERTLARRILDEVHTIACYTGLPRSVGENAWTSEIETLSSENRLFASVGYFLFTAQA
jgi:hypothetical protein